MHFQTTHENCMWRLNTDDVIHNVITSICHWFHWSACTFILHTELWTRLTILAFFYFAFMILCQSLGKHFLLIYEYCWPCDVDLDPVTPMTQTGVMGVRKYILFKRVFWSELHNYVNNFVTLQMYMKKKAIRKAFLSDLHNTMSNFVRLHSVSFFVQNKHEYSYEYAVLKCVNRR